MKQIFYIILTLSILTSCQTKTSDSQEEIESEKADLVGESTEQPKQSKEQSDNSIFIKDSSDYSTNFLQEMKKSKERILEKILFLCRMSDRYKIGLLSD